MAYFIIYLIGCIISFFIIGYHNDETDKDYNKYSLYYILLSWMFIIVFLLTNIIVIFSYNPSYKDVKKFFTNLYNRKK